MTERPQLYRLRTEAELAALQRAAAEDQHTLVLPTHAVLQGGQIIGGLGLPSGALVTVWMDSKKAGALESLLAIQAAETVCREQQLPRALVACADTSPFCAKLPKLGLSRLGVTTLFLRNL
jgi:hypothetical protein